MIDKINNVKTVPLVNKGITYLNIYTSGGHNYFLTEEGKIFKLMETFFGNFYRLLNFAKYVVKYKKKIYSCDITQC